MIKKNSTPTVVFLIISVITCQSIAWQQNGFVQSQSNSSTNSSEASSEVVKGTEEEKTALRADTAKDTSGAFKVKTGKSPGKARGGDKLLRIENSGSLSFSPQQKSLALSENLIKSINENLHVCVQNAANKAGFQGELSAIHIEHMGGWVDRRVKNKSRSKPWSLHATGRALDISSIDFTMGGKKYKIPMTIDTYKNKSPYKKSGSKFYKEFSSCWSKENTNKCGFRPTIDCTVNTLHHDHIHISLPFCPRKKGIASW